MAGRLLNRLRFMVDRANPDGVAILVATPERAPKVVRINISLPEDVLAAVDSYAEANGYNRSGFLAFAAKKAMAA